MIDDDDDIIDLHHEPRCLEIQASMIGQGVEAGILRGLTPEEALDLTMRAILAPFPEECGPLPRFEDL